MNTARLNPGIPLLLNGVTKRYGDNTILNELDLHIPSGQFVAVVGRSGGGKSTLLRLLAGLEKPNAGELLAGATPLAAIQDDTRMMFQDARLLPWKTVIDNVGLGLKGAWRDAALQALASVGLESRAQEWPAALSGGQKQRVALARALVAEPALLLLDEPLSNLDAKLRESMRFEIKDIQKQYGITVVYVTHDQTEAMAMSDRIVVINRGVIQQVGSPKVIYNEPANPFIADFVGKIEFLEGRVEAGYIALNGCGQKLPYEGDAKGDVIVGIRPEHVKYAEAGKGTLHGVVKTHFYLGDVDDCRIDLGGGKELRIIADPYESVGVEAGKAIELDVRNFLVYPAEQPGEDFRRILT